MHTLFGQPTLWVGVGVHNICTPIHAEPYV